MKNMKEIRMMNRAAYIIDVCAGVKQGERALIVTDVETMDVTQAFAGCLYERGIETTVVIIPKTQMTGQEPTAAAAAAMCESDVVFQIVNQSVSHSVAAKVARAKGARMIALSNTNADQIVSKAYQVDFEKWAPVCDKFGEYFTQASTIRVVSDAGTDFKADVTGRKGNSMPCIARTPGSATALPNIEANISPVEGTSEGIIVIDGSIPNFGIGLIETPIKLTVEKGSVCKVEGGYQADELRRILASVNDPAAYNIAQIALGLNPQCRRLTGNWQNFDHASFGRIHFGIGTSSALLGGNVQAPLHFDVHLESSVAYFDDKMLIDNGKVLGVELPEEV